MVKKLSPHVGKTFRKGLINLSETKNCWPNLGFFGNWKKISWNQNKCNWRAFCNETKIQAPNAQGHKLPYNKQEFEFFPQGIEKRSKWNIKSFYRVILKREKLLSFFRKKCYDLTWDIPQLIQCYKIKLMKFGKKFRIIQKNHQNTLTLWFDRIIFSKLN